MRHAAVLASSLALLALLTPTPARAQARERSAEEVLLELTSTYKVGLLLDDEGRAKLRDKRLTFNGPNNGPVLTTIEALLRMSGVEYERVPPNGTLNETLFVVRGKAAAPAATPAPEAEAAARVAVVDLKALFAAHPRKQALEAQVNGERERLKAELEREHERLRDLRRQAELRGGDPEARAELERAAKGLEAHTQRAQQALKHRVEHMTAELMQDVEAAVAALAQREGLAVVLARQPDDEDGRRAPPVVVWSTPRLDVTAAAVEELRRRVGAPGEQRGEY